MSCAVLHVNKKEQVKAVAATSNNRATSQSDYCCSISNSDRVKVCASVCVKQKDCNHFSQSIAREQAGKNQIGGAANVRRRSICSIVFCRAKAKKASERSSGVFSEQKVKE